MMDFRDYKQRKYALTERENGSRQKRTSVIFMLSLYCLKAYKGGCGVWKSPNLSMRTLWMVRYLNNRSYLEIKCLFKKLGFILTRILIQYHCGKSVQIRSFFWSIFSRVPTEHGDLWRKIQSECGEKTPYLDTFHIV